MPKFFINSNQIENNNVIIIGDDVKHISNVLRMKTGDTIQVCNIDCSDNYLVELVNFEKEKVEGKIINKIESEAESNVYINIFQGIPKSDKMELIIQKSTELGIKEFSPVDMERCVSKISSKDEKKKIERWQKIAEVAAKQSGRDMIPKVNNVIKIKDVCQMCENYDVVLVPYEKADGYTLKNAIDELKNKNIEKLSIGIVIGPEGGFDVSEIDMLKKCGAKIITLGKRILRTETVALSMASIIMYEFGGNI